MCKKSSHADLFFNRLPWHKPLILQVGRWVVTTSTGTKGLKHKIVPRKPLHMKKGAQRFFFVFEVGVGVGML
jgi:hypothetical protein